MGQTQSLSKRESLKRIRKLGVAPRTVFDVGVALGTSGLYGVFPDVRYVLVEPLEESVPFMRRFVAEHPGSIAVHAGAGREAGAAELVVCPTLSGSSFLTRPQDGEPRTVPMVTLDGLIEAHGLEPPYLIKLDVQGYELEVLAGAERALRDTMAVIVETSLWADRKGQGMPTMFEIMQRLRQHRFVPYDIAQIVRRPTDGAITELDLVFCPAKSPLRTVKTYKTQKRRDAKIEQRRRQFGLD